MKMLALNINGDITYCTVSPEMRGKGRCNHIAHQEPNESPEEFISRIDEKIHIQTEKDQKDFEKSKSIGQDEINELASRIDKIAGVKITQENFKEVLSSLSPDQIDEITNVAFIAAPAFSLPISSERYDEENIKNKLYFANLPVYGISGKVAAIAQMFDKVGPSPTLTEIVDIQNSYQTGLTPEEYFVKQFSARASVIHKGVSTSKPGYCIWEHSVVEVKNESNQLEKIIWSDVSLGDEFVDGSQVVHLADWKMKPCFEIKLKGFDKIVVSHDHLLFGDILINNRVIDNLEKSVKARHNIGENSTKWLCAEDCFEMFQLGAMLILNEDSKVEYIKKFNNGIPQRVRCISSSTGFYETNGLVHHNTARKLFYCLSDVQVVNDCGGPYIDAMHCQSPEGHVCVKCAKLTKGGERVKVGQLIGGLLSTNLAEGLTQLSMSQKHIGTIEGSDKLDSSNVIMGTLDGWGTSPIIQKMKEAETTEKMREILCEGLRQQYQDAGVRQDSFNLQMIARKMTSYKRTANGLEPINPGEKACVASMNTIGNFGNIFKVAELTTGYKHLTKPIAQKIKTDASNEIIR